MKKALVIGTNGTLGREIAAQLAERYHVVGLSRENISYTEDQLDDFAERLREQGGVNLVICCIGMLHSDSTAPEKRLADLSTEGLLEYYRVNTVVPALCMRSFLPVLKKGAKTGSKYVCLSAMVGSIGENQLGGWYGYRSSKAALNMVVKTAAIELNRINRAAVLVAMHPGTTRGPLSKPFASRMDPARYYSPEVSARRIIQRIEELRSEDNGQFLNWDGRQIAW